MQYVDDINIYYHIKLNYLQFCIELVNGLHKKDNELVKENHFSFQFKENKNLAFLKTSD